jgi:hypothetical protein
MESGWDVLRALARHVEQAAERREKKAAAGGPEEPVHRTVAQQARFRAAHLDRSADRLDESLPRRERTKGDHV